MQDQPNSSNSFGPSDDNQQTQTDAFQPSASTVGPVSSPFDDANAGDSFGMPVASGQRDSLGYSGNTSSSPLQDDDNHAMSQIPATPSTRSTQSNDSMVSASNNYQSEVNSSESLDDQNIFYMLDAEDGSEEQKNQFLDELQQIIWEDFLENDTKLLLTTDESTQLSQLVGNDFTKPLIEQDQAIDFLERLIPDLEDLMLEKALQLKGELFRERIASLKELYVDEPARLEIVERAELFTDQDKWFSAAKTLNEMFDTTV